MIDEDIPGVRLEHMSDGVVVIEQDTGGNVDRVALHPLHVRHLAEKMGLVATCDPHARKTIATLSRRLRLLRDRIDHLGEYLTKFSDHAHADLEYELTYITATAELANEFCAELIEVPPGADAGPPDVKPAQL